MRVGVIQSNYIPWRGYFDFIAGVDLFVFHDDLQYTKGDWRNRNRIKTPAGLRWLTVPVHYRQVDQAICETEIVYSQRWQDKHLGQIRSHYSGAGFVSDAADLLSSAFSYRDRTISELNVRLIRFICKYLSIDTPLRMSSEFEPAGRKTDRLIDLLVKTEASVYLSGPAAKSYVHESRFRDAAIGLEYKGYVYRDYPQLWGDFNGAVTVLDLIANCGPDSRRYLNSLEANEVAVP